MNLFQKTFDIVTVGNAIMDAILLLQDATAHVRLDQKKKELCVKAGEKILLDSCTFQLGGGGSNVAVGLSRLGYAVSIFTEVGNDDFAYTIFKTLQREKIDTRYVQRVNKQSSFTLGLNFKEERTLFTNQSKGPHNFYFDDVKTSFLYLAAVGQEWEQAYERAGAYVHKNHVKMAFNPGPLQIQEGRIEIIELLQHTNVLFLNKEEVQEVFQTKEDSIVKLLTIVKQKGVKIVVITDGQRGSYVMDQDGKLLSLGSFPCKIVEKTGAGDAYATGFVAAIMKGYPVSQAMRWGAINSASVIEKIGAQEGLLRQEQLMQKLEDSNDFQPKEI